MLTFKKMCFHTVLKKRDTEMQSDRKMLRDDQWEKIEALLPGKVGDPGRSGENNRQFVEAVLWIVRTSSP